MAAIKMKKYGFQRYDGQYDGHGNGIVNGQRLYTCDGTYYGEYHDSHHNPWSENLMAQGQRYIYAVFDGRSCGPFSLQELTSMIRDGRVTAETYLWKAGMPDWMKAKDVTDIAPIVNEPPVFNK